LGRYVAAMQTTGRARRMWRALEPYHALTYFAPESRAAAEALGARGGWMSYFALRAAPLGPVPADVVVATFYNFAPGRVGRAIPAAWEAAAPEAYLRARAEAIDAALRRALGPEVVGSAAVAEAAELAREAALAASVPGSGLGAANAALPWPAEPHLALWHAQTVLREFRGDAHVAALQTAGLDPVETLVTFAADRGLDAETLRGHRGWSAQEWAAAGARLRDRGLVDAAGALTAEGAALRQGVEDATDRAAAPSWDALGPDRCERLVELARPLVAAIGAAGGLPRDNPIGLRPLG
jgi:muconolactone delta-isomerase